jgi:hypothetical protein
VYLIKCENDILKMAFVVAPSGAARLSFMAVATLKGLLQKITTKDYYKRLLQKITAKVTTAAKSGNDN